MIDAAERRAAVRAAMRLGHVGASAWLCALPGRARLYDWRRRVGLAGRRAPEPCMAGPAAPAGDWADEVTRLARRRHAVRLPPRAPDRDTWRAAGARRLPWPDGAPDSDDPQDVAAWHRLHWTLECAAVDLAPRLQRWLRTTPDAAASHPYSTAERICVLAEVLGSRAPALPTSLRHEAVARIAADADWLARHLEVQLGVQNHLLNDARGLHVAGCLLRWHGQAEAWRGIARELWDTYFPPLVLEDGVFAEQSTSYHLLLTRTLLEYALAALEDGEPLDEAMAERARAMCGVTNLLVRPDGSLPRFGDVTPDMPGAWMAGLPSACASAGLLVTAPRHCARGYAAGASRLPDPQHALRLPEARTNGWRARLLPWGGLLWARHEALDVELAAHGDPRAVTACHGDAGRGSFELWRAGRRFVVDGGMPSYSGPRRDAFRAPGGQNTLALDGVAPAILAGDEADLPAWYRAAVGGGGWRASDGEASFAWLGFRRAFPGMRWTRTWRWGESEVTVEDALDGWAGTATVEACVHFGEPAWRATGARAFAGEGCTLDVDGPAWLRAALEAMPVSDEYGLLRASAGVRVQGRGPLPARWSWRFAFGRDR